MKGKLIIAAIVAQVLTGCYYDVEEELYPFSGNCDTTLSNFSTIQPILQSNGCMSCHSGGAPSGNISLEDYTRVKAVANSGQLLGAITHANGFAPMPQGGNKLSECNINKVRAWINAGMPEN